MQEPKEIRIVGPVFTNTDNPWRTQGDYRKEQRQQVILFFSQIITALIAIASIIISTYFSLKSASEPQKVIVEVVHRHVMENSATVNNEPPLTTP